MYEHVITRGNNRRTLFHNPSDYQAFYRILIYAHTQHTFTIIAYCLMTNHYHLLIRSPEVPLGKVMSLINKRYGDYYRRKYGATGYLYEGRYYAEKADGPKGILEVSRYIHRNPIAAKEPLAPNMEDYPYSSFHYYMTGEKPVFPFLDTGQIISLLTMPYEQTSESYRKYCEESRQE